MPWLSFGSGFGRAVPESGSLGVWESGRLQTARWGLCRGLAVWDSVSGRLQTGRWGLCRSLAVWESVRLQPGRWGLCLSLGVWETTDWPVGSVPESAVWETADWLAGSVPQSGSLRDCLVGSEPEYGSLGDYRLSVGVWQSGSLGVWETADYPVGCAGGGCDPGMIRAGWLGPSPQLGCSGATVLAVPKAGVVVSTD